MVPLFVGMEMGLVAADLDPIKAKPGLPGAKQMKDTPPGPPYRPYRPYPPYMSVHA